LLIDNFDGSCFRAKVVTPLQIKVVLSEYLKAELDASITLLVGGDQFVEKAGAGSLGVSVGLVKTEHNVIIQNSERLHGR
jgi:hypothetical protein